MRVGDILWSGGTARVHMQCVKGNMGQRWGEGLQRAVPVCRAGEFSPLALNTGGPGLHCACGFVGEDKTESWQKVLDWVVFA